MKKTARELKHVVAPVGVSCELCGLDPDPGSRGAFQLTVMYGGKVYGDEGNELTPLWRHPWVCESCIETIIAGWRAAARS